jgi:hypothetical protein
MASPTLVSVTNTAYNTNFTNTNSIASISANNGDLLLIFAAAGDAVNVFSTVTATGSATLTVTNRQIQTVGSTCPVGVWTAPVTATGTYTVTVNYSAGGSPQGMSVVVLRGHGGVGVSSKGSGSSSAPSLAISTGTANSMVFSFVADWDAVDGSSRTWRTINSTTPTSGNGLEELYARDASYLAVYMAEWTDVGATGSKTTGLSAPSTMKWSSVAIEIKGGTTTVSPTATATDTHGATAAAKQVQRTSATATDTHSATAAAKQVQRTSATATDTHGATAAAKTVVHPAATATDTHSATAALAAVTALAATAADTHGATAAAMQVQRAGATAADTHSATAAAKVVKNLGATAADTHSATATAEVDATWLVSATGTDTHSAAAVLTVNRLEPVRFPDRLSVRIEGAVGHEPDSDQQFWTWQDFTEWAFIDASPGPITIERGRQDEMDEAQPSTMTVVLDNADGRFTPGRPDSPYYPGLRLGMPMRVAVDNADLPVGYQLAASAFGYIYSGDSSLNLTGDLDIQMELTPRTWRPATAQMLASKYVSSDTSRSWALILQTDGTLMVLWTTAGTLATRQVAVSPSAVPSAARRYTIRVQVDVSSGSGWAVTFLAGRTPSVLSSLGSASSGSGGGSLYAGDQPVTLGSGPGGANYVTGVSRFDGVINSFTLRNGIAGAVVAAPDFEDNAVPGTTLFYDPQGNAWLVLGDGAFVDNRIRMTGIVSEISPTWPYGDRTDTTPESRVKIVVAGLTRRLANPGSPAHSSLYRGFTVGGVDGVVDYWPMEDAAGSRSLANPLGGATAQYKGGIELAANSDAPGSEAIPTLTTGLVYAPVRAGMGTGYLRVMWWLSVPEDGVAATTRLVQVSTDGTVATWSLYLGTDGSLSIVGKDADGSTIVSAGPIAFTLNGAQGLVWIYVEQSGADINWQFGASKLGATSTGVWNGTRASSYAGAVQQVNLGPNSSGDLGGGSMGHLVVLNSNAFWDIVAFANAWNGETALERVQRLGTEEGLLIGHRQGTDSTDMSTPMGYQSTASVLDLLRECATADTGVLYEPRDYLGLALRLRASMYDPAVLVALDAAYEGLGDITHPFEPVLDDALVANDVTASRADGSSANVTDEADIAERGRYTGSVTANVASDSQLINVAGWLLHLGTYPGMRYPSVSPALEVDGHMLPWWSALDVGDSISVDNLPEQHPTGAVQLIAQGFTEAISPTHWETTINTTPADSWFVGEISASNTPDTRDRLDTDGSALAADVTNSATTLSVTSSGIHWITTSTHPGDFPFLAELGGEQVSVTAISGTGSTQSFTVTRSVNGIVKAHAAGTDVRLAHPMILAR